MESNIYNYEVMKAMMKGPKKDLLPNDVLIYKNGEKGVLYAQYYWMLLKLYDDNLNHIYNDDYSIIEDKKIEKIPYHFSLNYVKSNLTKEEKDGIDNAINGIYNKINEIIDKINEVE